PNAAAFPRLDRRPRQHDAPNALAGQRVDGRGDGEIRLSRSCRTDADDDVVVVHLTHVIGLARRFRLNDAPDAGERDALRVDSQTAIDVGELVAVVAIVSGVANAPTVDLVAQPQHVVCRELQLLTSRLDPPPPD